MDGYRTWIRLIGWTRRPTRILIPAIVPPVCFVSFLLPRHRLRPRIAPSSPNPFLSPILSAAYGAPMSRFATLFVCSLASLLTFEWKAGSVVLGTLPSRPCTFGSRIGMDVEQRLLVPLPDPSCRSLAANEGASASCIPVRETCTHQAFAGSDSKEF